MFPRADGVVPVAVRFGALQVRMVRVHQNQTLAIDRPTFPSGPTGGLDLFQLFNTVPELAKVLGARPALCMGPLPAEQLMHTGMPELELDEDVCGVRGDVCGDEVAESVTCTVLPARASQYPVTFDRYSDRNQLERSDSSTPRRG